MAFTSCHDRGLEPATPRWESQHSNHAATPTCFVYVLARSTNGQFPVSYFGYAAATTAVISSGLECGRTGKCQSFFLSLFCKVSDTKNCLQYSLIIQIETITIFWKPYFPSFRWEFFIIENENSDIFLDESNISRLRNYQTP